MCEYINDTDIPCWRFRKSWHILTGRSLIHSISNTARTWRNWKSEGSEYAKAQLSCTPGRNLPGQGTWLNSRIICWSSLCCLIHRVSKALSGSRGRGSTAEAPGESTLGMNGDTLIMQWYWSTVFPVFVEHWMAPYANSMCCSDHVDSTSSWYPATRKPLTIISRYSWTLIIRNCISRQVHVIL